MLELANALYPVWVVLFMTLFVAIVAWALWPSRRQQDRMDDHANIPFRNEEPDGKAR
jgi:cbb3-type cytochrome oxidase subunit 3